MSGLRITIEGVLGEISVRSFLASVDHALRIADDLDQGISGEHRGSLDWVIRDLEMGSLVVTVEARSRLADRNFGPEVIRAFVSGMSILERGGSTPPFFSETSMKHAQTLARMVGRNGTAGFQFSDFSTTAEVSAHTAVNIEPLIRVKSWAFGSVEGLIETVSVHRKPRFIVYQDGTRKPVTVRFDTDEWLEKVLEAVKAGRRVVVSGMVQYNARGEPLSIDFDSVAPLRPESSLPRAAELTGADPQFTGGLATEDYIRSVRGG
ncbi:MAG: hypothetical protein ACKVVP_10440 [Chloroflexota bacterium]